MLSPFWRPQEEAEFLCLLLPPVFFATFGRFPWLVGRPPRCRSKGYDKQRGAASREKARFVIRGENAETFQLQPAAGAELEQQQPQAGPPLFLFP